jgi:hypothetical protein
MTSSIPITQSGNRGKWMAAAVVIIVWFALALASSLLGVFDSNTRPPLLLGSAAILPVTAFAVAYLFSASFRRFVLSANARAITFAHTWRIGGLVFLILYWRGQLPGAFALPAGWGDIAIGVTAPLVAWNIESRGRSMTPLLTVWNLLGLLDLLAAVTLGVLSSASRLGILAGDVTTRIMGAFPLSLIPTFFVPLLMILHLVALGQIAEKRSPA